MDTYNIYNVSLGNDSKPAILLKFIQEVDICIVVPLTNNISFSSLPYTVQITEPNGNNVALIFQIKSLSSKILSQNPIAKLEEDQVKKINTIIREMFQVN